MGSRRRWLALLFLLTFPLLPKIIFAQTNEITHADFWAGVRLAFVATRNAFPRRETETYERLRDGKTTFRRTKTMEYAAADNFHHITATVDGDLKSVKEMIQVSKERFCRENSDEWRTSKCYENPPAALEDAIESSFWVEKNKKRIIYTRRSTFVQSEAGKIEPTKFISEDVLELNSDLTIRERTITKSAVETRMILSRETRVHEYGLKLKPIESPIK